MITATRAEPAPHVASRRSAIGVLAVAVLAQFVLIASWPAAIGLARDLPLALRVVVDLSPYLLGVGVVVLALRVHRAGWAPGLGFSWRDLPRQLGIAAVLYLVTISLVVVPLLFGVESLGQPESRTGFLIYGIVRLMVFVGLGEELVWRGYVLERLRAVTGSGWAAVAVSAALFGLWHLPVGQDVFQVLGAGAIGFLYAAARLKVRGCSTLATGLAHGLHDVTILLLATALV